MAITNQRTTLVWVLHELFHSVASEGDCRDAVQLSFCLLLPRLRPPAAVESESHQHQPIQSHQPTQQRSDDEATLRAFLEAQFQQQVERNRKRKEDPERMNQNFTAFLIGLEERSVAPFDASTTIFETLDANNATDQPNPNQITHSQPHTASLAKQLTENWHLAIDELLAIAKWKQKTVKKPKNKRMLF